MARFASLFCVVVAAVTAASAAAVQERDSVLATLFIDINYSGQSLRITGDIPTGCLTPPPAFARSVSSIQLATGVKCTLWSEPLCTGGSVTLAVNTPDLRVQGFNDQMVSIQCLPN